MSKQKASKLDQYAETLLEMDGQNQTLAQMQAWLKAEGCVVSAGRLSEFLSSARSRKLQAQLLGQIASGARQCQEVEKQFGKNPAPELETLIKLQRVLILNLSTQASADPELLKLVATTFSSVMESERLKIKRGELDLNQRRVALLEKKAAQADAAKGILENKQLTEAQRAARMREVFGISK